MDKKLLLKIKLKSLAAEARIIRTEEKRQRRYARHEKATAEHAQLADEMYWHRTRELRTAARETHLAYGYLKGRTYRQIEPRTVDPMATVSSYSKQTVIDWENVKRMVKYYGGTELSSDWIPPVLTDEEIAHYREVDRAVVQMRREMRQHQERVLAHLAQEDGVRDTGIPYLPPMV